MLTVRILDFLSVLLPIQSLLMLVVPRKNFFDSVSPERLF
jgi:hypothetical protein